MATRYTLRVDSASTRDIRDLCVGLHRAGHTGELRVGVNGPEAWVAETPPLYDHEFRTVLDNLGGRTS